MDKSIIDVKNKCCGCGLCVVECPFNAIQMKENKEGFLYPSINKKLCKNCGKCSQICISKNQYNKSKNEIKKAYMVINRNLKEYKESASGGFATVLSKYVIKELKGTVYGAILDSKHNVKHILVDKMEELHLLQGSKYVQSNIQEVYETIKDQLSKKYVLFIGTPCQVDALRRYTNDSKKLITCDLVCHGVPSPGYFKKYINYLENKYNDKIIDFRFRNKSNFDKCGFVEKIVFKNKKSKKVVAERDPFYSDFIKEKNYRYSCYSCGYKNRNRTGDFTIGDVASWENYYDFFPEKATSLVITNNKKAEKILQYLNNNLLLKEISIEKEEELNIALTKQKIMNAERKDIYKYYSDFSNYEKKVLKNIGKKEKIKIISKKILPFSIRIKIRKIQRGK